MGHIGHVNESNLYLTGWEATAIIKFIKARNSEWCFVILSFKQKAGRFHVVSYRSSQFST